MMRRLATVILTISVCFSLLPAEDESKENPEQTTVRVSLVQHHSMVANTQAAIMSGDGALPETAGVPGHSAVASRNRRNKARIILHPKGTPKIILYPDPEIIVQNRKTPNDSADISGARKRKPSVDPGSIVEVDPDVDPEIIIPVDRDVDPDIIINPSPAHDTLEFQLRPWEPDSGK